MKKIIQSFLLLCVVIGFSVLPTDGNESKSENNPRGPTDLVELEAFLDGIMAAHMKTYHIAGATFSLVKDGEIFFAKGYGYADVKNRKSVKAETTLFRPGSVSKLFTWTAVMQLVEQGKLDLNADVNTYLKDFKVPDTYPEPITLTHLLTHTPGLEDVWGGMAARSADDLVPLDKFLADKMPPRFLPPGKITAYSNYGTALAGYIVQEISGMPFEDYVEENIFKPLDMQYCTFRQPLPSHLAGDMSVGYSYKDGLFKAEEFEFINGMAPAGSLSASAKEMAKFMIAHLQNGKYGEKRILKEETAKLMRTQLFTHDSRLDGNAYGFWERTLNHIPMIGHGGDTIWFHSLLILIPEQNIGFFVSYNSAGAGALLQDRFLQAFIDHYYPIPEPTEPKSSLDFKKRAGRFTGFYGMARGVFSTYEKLANLMMLVKVKATDEGTLLTPYPAGLGAKQWVEVEPLVFRELGGQETLVFQEDSQGRITHAFISEFPMFALVKLPWYQSPMFHYSLLAVSMILLLSTLAWPIGALFRVLCKRKKEEKRAPKIARWIAGVMSVLFMLFVLGMVGTLSDQMNIMFGVPPLLKILLVLPLMSVVLAIGTLIVAFLAWKNKYWSGCERLHYTLIVLAALAFIWFLNYWNLLGFRF
jgi:CubicO group peptidase (beta-lactamase class C family)